MSSQGLPGPAPCSLTTLPHHEAPPPPSGATRCGTCSAQALSLLPQGLCCSLCLAGSPPRFQELAPSCSSFRSQPKAIISYDDPQATLDHITRLYFTFFMAFIAVGKHFVHLLFISHHEKERRGPERRCLSVLFTAMSSA